MTTTDLYTVPEGVRLDTHEVRFALEAASITTDSYVANRCLNHVFRHRCTGAKLFVVESGPGQPKRLTEVAGDAALWLTVRSIAAQAARASQLRSQTPTPAGTAA